MYKDDIISFHFDTTILINESAQILQLNQYLLQAKLFYFESDCFTIRQENLLNKKYQNSIIVLICLFCNVVKKDLSMASSLGIEIASEI